MGFRKIQLPPIAYKLRIERSVGLWYDETEIFEISEYGRLYMTIKKKVPEYDERMRKLNETARRGYRS